MAENEADSPAEDQKVDDQTQQANQEEQTQTGEEATQTTDGGEETQDGEGEVKPKSLNRFQEIVGKAKEATKRAEEAEKERDKLKTQLGDSSTKKYEIDPDKEYTVDELNKMLGEAQKAGEGSASLEVKKLREEIETKEATRDYQSNLNEDISYLESTYPELDENSDDYNPELHTELTELYKELAIDDKDNVNPSISLKSIGDRFMRGAGYSAAEASDKTAKTVARQASRAERGDSTPRKKQVIDADWFTNEYDPSKPEHKKIAQEYISKKQYE